jgi:hypothetical protein
MEPGDKTAEDQLKELMKEALATKIIKKKNKAKGEALYDALDATIKEFLEAYILIGFDMNGTPVLMKASKNEMEEAALQTIYLKSLQGLYEP